jgi:hypothetical protein
MSALLIIDLAAAMAAVDIACWGMAARAPTVPLELHNVRHHGIRVRLGVLETPR